MDEKQLKLDILKNAIVMLIGGYLQGQIEEIENIPSVLRAIATDYEEHIRVESSEQ